MCINFCDQRTWSSYDTTPHVYDPQTGNIAYLPAKNVSKFIVQLIPILHKIFKTFLKNSVLKYNFEDHICDPQTANTTYFPVEKVSKINAHLIPVLNKILDFCAKIQFRRSHRWSSKLFKNGRVVTSVATFIPSHMCKILIKKRWIRRECYFEKSAYARTPLQKGYGRPAVLLQWKLSISTL